ncbi:MAG: hypothetical protein ABFE13_11365 [Phycisphaerales bacterium]
MAGKTTAMAASTANPYLLGAGLVADVGGALLGSPQPKEQTTWYEVPEQLALLRQLLAQQYAGGDVGLGADLKAGNATLAQSMANRGISPQSGIYQSAMGGMTADAVAKAAQNRFQNLYALLGASAPKVTGKIGDPSAPAGYAWDPTGLKRRVAGMSGWGTPDVSYRGGY